VLGKCNLANTACVSVSCSTTGIMAANIRPDLFGISDEELALFQDGTQQLTLNDGSCPIGFDYVSNRFQINETVTHCGNVAINADT